MDEVGVTISGSCAPAMSGAPFRVLGGGGVLRTLCWTGGCLFRVWRAIAGLPVGTCVGSRVVVTGGAPDCDLGAAIAGLGAGGCVTSRVVGTGVALV